jgi:hypothetical protein
MIGVLDGVGGTEAAGASVSGYILEMTAISKN